MLQKLRLFRCCRTKEQINIVQEKKDEEPPLDELNISNVELTKLVPERSVPDDSTAALVELVISSAVPIVRKALSKKLVESKCILFNEKLVEEFDEYQEEDNLPIGKIEIKLEDVLIMDSQTVHSDMLAAPDFSWPEKDRIDDLMATAPGTAERKMLVLDFVGFNCFLPLGKGIEIAFPIDLPILKANVEIGSGGDIEEGSIRLEVPRIRVWFVTETKKLYVAFLDKPDLTPNLHVNLDRGKGDFLNFSLVERGNLDDVVEEVLCGFGPKQFTGKDETEQEAEKQSKTQSKWSSSNWAGVAVGKQISSIVLNNMGRSGKGNIPIEVDLSETIKSVIDVAMGMPRPVEVIEAQIALLEKELERSKAIAAEEDATITQEEDAAIAQKEGVPPVWSKGSRASSRAGSVYSC